MIANYLTEPRHVLICEWSWVLSAMTAVLQGS